MYNLCVHHRKYVLSGLIQNIKSYALSVFFMTLQKILDDNLKAVDEISNKHVYPYH